MALERLRWLPAEFGPRYVFLNQPAFEVSYFNGTDAPLTMRAVIGKRNSQTYFFTDRIKEITFNPYWNVPRSIIVNEMLPKLWRNPSYLDRLGYEVSNNRGREVASSSVDWAAVATQQIGMNVRQPPGPGNALGRLKIDFPNKHAIYLHDTNQKHLFAREQRAFSHGCVRLERPREMAAALLGRRVTDIDKKIASGENQTERVPGDIPVYLAYFTAWPDAQGNVRYYKDVYDRDAHLAKAIAKTREARSTF
jgi:L,D-transpeptidase YcbB